MKSKHIEISHDDVKVGPIAVQEAEDIFHLVGLFYQFSILVQFFRHSIADLQIKKSGAL